MMERLQETSREDDLRDRAIRRLKKKRDFQGHVIVFLLVNTFLVVIWAATGAGFFWPIFPIVGWGVGVVMNAWDVYRSDEPDEAQIRREMEALEPRHQKEPSWSSAGPDREPPEGIEEESRAPDQVPVEWVDNQTAHRVNR